MPIWGSHPVVADLGGATCGLSCGQPQPRGDRGPPSLWGGGDGGHGRAPPSPQSPKPELASVPPVASLFPPPARAKGRRDPAPRSRKFGFLPMMGISQGDGCSLRRANGSRQEKPPLPRPRHRRCHGVLAARVTHPLTRTVSLAGKYHRAIIGAGIAKALEKGGKNAPKIPLGAVNESLQIKAGFGVERRPPPCPSRGPEGLIPPGTMWGCGRSRVGADPAPFGSPR